MARPDESGVGEFFGAGLPPCAGHRHHHAVSSCAPWSPARPSCPWSSPRGEAIWISSRDGNRVSVIEPPGTAQATPTVDSPSSIFFTSRAARMGFGDTCAGNWRCSARGNAVFRWCARRFSTLPTRLAWRWRRCWPATQLQTSGALSRIGGVFAGHAGGAALLAAMAVPPERLQAVAAQVSAHPGVNHNYEREHHYNLWFVMTGQDDAAVRAAPCSRWKTLPTCRHCNCAWSAPTASTWALTCASAPHRPRWQRPRCAMRCRLPPPTGHWPHCWRPACRWAAAV